MAESMGKTGKTVKSDFLIHAEFKPKLSALQVYITFQSGKNVAKIEITQDGSISICWKNTTSVEVRLAGLKLVPTQCHGMQFTGSDLLQFRIAAKPNNGVSFDAKPPALPDLLSSCRDKEVCVLCRHCEEELIPAYRFSRVLPLPSDNWLGGCGDWFCHGEPVGAERALSVRPGDCLMGDTCVMVSSCRIPQINIVKVDKKKTVVKCPRCKQSIGNVTEVIQGDKQEDVQSLRLSLQCVSISPVGITLKSHSAVSSLCALILHYSTDLNAFRFVVEVDSQPKLLLWLLEKDSVVYRGAYSNEDSCPVIEPQNTIKVLYLDGLREKNKSLCSTWNEDMTVHTISLPDTSYCQVMQTLVNSTKTLPMKTHNGFYLGLLCSS